MNRPDLLKKYQEMEIQTSSPEKLILLLYDEAIKCLNQVKTKLGGENIEEVNRLFLKTQKIIRELTCSLNLEVGEVSIRWCSLYEYIYQRLIQANIEKNPRIIEEVLSLLRPLREAWIKAMEQVNENCN